MKNFLIMSLVSLVSSMAWSQIQVQTLGEESLNNAKSVIVENSHMEDGIKVKVLTQFVGEPAMFPYRMKTYIQCPRAKNYKAMNLAKYILENYPTNMSRMVAAPASGFPQGVLQACFLENVNFDDDKLFITVFEPGSSHCDRSRVMDLMFPLSEFCGR